MAPTRWSVPSRVRSAPTQELHEPYFTADSDFIPDGALHSTVQLDYESKHVQRPNYRDHHSDSERSMSIEIGRAIDPAHHLQVEDSSQVAFAFNNDSQYEMTGTPPIRGATAMQNGTIKPSALRRANDSAKRSASQTAKVFSDLPAKVQAHKRQAGIEEWDDEDQATASIQAKTTRFGVVKRFASATQPKRAAEYDTASSWQLPDDSNIEELVLGRSRPSQQHIPLEVKLGRKPSRLTPARCTAQYEPQTERRPIVSVPIPDEEKKIYVSLQQLRDRIAELNEEKASALRQLNEYQDQVAELRSAMAQRRPHEALGSIGESTQEVWRKERTKLHSENRALRDQLSTSGRKTNLLSQQLADVTSEKDDLVTQLGIECFRLSKAENDHQICRAENLELVAANEHLKKELEIAREALAAAKLPQTRAGRPVLAEIGARSNVRPVVQSLTKEMLQQTTVPILDQEARDTIASTVQLQFQRLSHYRSVLNQASNADKRRTSKSLPNLFSGPLGLQPQRENKTYTEFEVTGTQPAAGNDDMTALSHNATEDQEDLRRELESVRRQSHEKQQQQPQITTAAKSTSQPRRSSFRDVTRRQSAQDVSATARVVRVQSPSSNQEQPEEGDTSDIILPDLTLQQPVSALGDKHDKASCTVCTPVDPASFPMPDFVSSRKNLPEDATLRPSQAPHSALSMVLKHLQDEKAHLDMHLSKLEQEYHARDPAVGERARIDLQEKTIKLRADCERKDKQIYALFDALEAHKHTSQGTSRAERAGHVGRSAPLFDLDGAYDNFSDVGSAHLPEWDGLSEAAT